MTPASAQRLVVAADPAAAAAAHILRSRARSIALAGGETPRALYAYLARCTYPWHETRIFLGDERCVPHDHPDSNFRMAREALLSHVPAPAFPMPASCDAAAYEALLQSELGERPRLDLVILGLGADGHTASLFPGDSALEETSRLVVAVDRPDHRRLTLTLPMLSAAREAVFLVAGAAKRSALAALVAGASIPAARVVAGQVTVFADRQAAG